MKRASGLLLILALAAGLLWRCGGSVDPEPIPNGISVQYNGTAALGGIVLQLPDADNPIDSTDIVYLGGHTGYTIVRISRVESETAWRLLLLRKRGRLGTGKLFGLTPDRTLYGDPVIIDACDTSGAMLPLGDFEVSLVDAE